MVGYNSADLVGFQRQAITFVETEKLLTWAGPYLQTFLAGRYEVAVNLKLGLFEQLQTQTRLIKQLVFPSYARQEAFASGWPGWADSITRRDRPKPGGTAFEIRPAEWADPSELLQSPTFTPPHLTNYLSFPLMGGTDGTEVAGVLEIEFEKPVAFVAEAQFQESLLTLGSVLVNTRLYEEAQQTIRQLRAVGANTAELATQPQLVPMLDMIVQRAVRLLEAETGTFYLVDQERQEAECVIGRLGNQQLIGVKLAFGAGLVGQIAQSGQYLIVDEYSNWSGRTAFFEALGEFHAVLGVPVFWGSEVIGVLCLVQTSPDRFFTHADADFLTLFAAQAASAITNSRLLETTLRSKRELELLYQTAELVNSNLEIGAICQAFVSELAEKFGYRLTFIYIKDAEGKLQLQAYRGYHEVIREVTEERGISGRVIRTKKAQLVGDASQEPDFLYAEPGITSGVFVPILDGEDLLGMIGMEAIGSRLGQADLRLLETMSSHLSVAIKNATLFRQIAIQSSLLQQRNQELEAVFQGMNEGLATSYRENGQYYLQVNPEGLRLMGWGETPPGREEVSNPAHYTLYLAPKGSLSVYDADEIPPRARLLTLEEWPTYRAWRGDRFSNYEVLLLGPDKHLRYLSFAGASLTDEAGKVVQIVVIFHDVTATRAVEQMKESFLSLVSHDLRGPLTAISGYAEQATLELDSGAAQASPIIERSLQVITRHSERLHRLVNDLLDMARLENGRLPMELFPFQVGALIRETCEHLLESLPQLAGYQADPHAPHKPYLTLDLTRKMPKVLLDQQRFDQVLTNLVSNAVKYSKEGGEIRLTYGLDPTRPGFVRLEVSDQGIGIVPEKLTRLFNRFYRTEQARQGGYSGTGLGLYICQLMVEALGGQIWAESDGPNQGATFVVVLPLAPAGS